MDKKVLIYFDEKKIKPCGGPAGYLYNLRNELQKKGIENISFLHGASGFEKKKGIFAKLPKWFQDGYHVAKRVRNVRNMKAGGSATVDFSQYDAIHFHDTFSLYTVRNQLKDYKGKIIVQSHSPKPYYLEMMDKAKGIEKKIYKHQETFLKSVEETAFRLADYIIFPCPEAEEPYYNNMDSYAAIHEGKKDDYRYLLTGISDISVKEDKIRERYHIPQDAFVISYVGRHNETKGYDLLKEIGKSFLDKNPNTYVLVAGKEEPLKGLQHERWIEIGWTNNPHAIIQESDVFLLPNRETYFDLVLLEVLAVGKIVVASNTGGNKYFKRYGDEAAISLYDSVEEAEHILAEYSQMSREERGALDGKNRRIYEKYFTSEIFAENYLNILEEICQ